MCPGDMDAPAVANSHIPTKKSKKDIFMIKEQSLWKPWDDIDHF